MSEKLIEIYGFANYKLAELAYKTYGDNLNERVVLIDFDKNTKEIQEAWIKSVLIVTKNVLKNQERFFFMQDNDNNWYKIPLEKQDEFIKAVAFNTVKEQFAAYKLYDNNIENISFINPQNYPF